VSTLLLADGIGTIIAGGVGAWLGGLMTIAAVVSGYNLLFGLMFCGFVTKRIGGQLRNMLVPVLATFFFGILALSMTSFLTFSGAVDNSKFWQATMLVVIYAVTYLGLARLFLKDSVREILSLALRGISGLTTAQRVTR
jgi:hypothetical protein